MSDETRPDREALQRTVRAIVSRRLYAVGAAKPDTWAAEIASDLDALIPAPHPQGGTPVQAVCVHDDGFEHASDGTLPCPITDGPSCPHLHEIGALRSKIEASAAATEVVAREAERMARVNDGVSAENARLRALLAAAPAPTEAGEGE